MLISEECRSEAECVLALLPQLPNILSVSRSAALCHVLTCFLRESGQLQQICGLATLKEARLQTQENGKQEALGSHG